MVKQRKKRSLVLLELMIALMILGLLSAGIARAARGALDVARYRKSLDQRAQIGAALDNHLLERGEPIESVIANWRQIAQMSPLIGNRDPLKDGWGYDFECYSAKSQHEMVRAAQQSNGEGLEFDRFIIVSKGLYGYQKRFGQQFAIPK